MKKLLWAVAAGVCVLAVVILAIIYIPPLLDNSPPPDVPEGHMVLMPGHWWKADLTEQQRNSLAAAWGNDMSAAELLRSLWPDPLQEMPEEAVAVYQERTVGWPTDTYEAWKGEMLCNCRASSNDIRPTMCCLYIGTHQSEQFTFQTVDNRGFTENCTYRISIYTGDQY